MNLSRRKLLKVGSVAAPVLAASLRVPAIAATGTGLPAGLDPLTVYRQMFASTKDAASCCWWYLGVTRSPVPGMGDVATRQVETIMVFKTENIGSDGLKIYWKEIGCFRDLTTGELPMDWTNPINGAVEKRPKSFADGPAHYTVKRAADGLSIELDQTHAKILKIAITFAVADGQVCLTQTEDKIRGIDSPTPNPIQTMLKFYAPLSALSDPTQPSVRASGFYSIRPANPGANPLLVDGIMQKATTDEHLNPIAWDRMNQAYPAFFKNGKVDPDWT